jgi:GNAT superfamily N-acetyltransferase
VKVFRSSPWPWNSKKNLAAAIIMETEIRFDCTEVDWNVVSETLRLVGMAYYAPDLHRQAFSASHTTVFAWHAGRLIGFGRAISDGMYQAAIYDVAVVPEYQAKGVGTRIMQSLLAGLSHCNIILYASPGKEGFYRSLQFRNMKTAMALFTRPAVMTEKGFTE